VLADILQDVAKRPYITVGFASFLMLIPLALTSTNAMIRRLGAKRWQQLHRLVYLIGIGGVVHFLWLVKSDIREPLVYGAVLALLLGFRLWDRRHRTPDAIPSGAVR
jgi:sulfoxide reductase heme-binding subunit YedZ